MKDSEIEWIGNIPKTWEIRPLFTMFKEGKNKNIDGAERNLLSLSYGKIVRKNIMSNEGLVPENYYSYNIIDKGDIIIRPTDLQNDKKSLRTGIASEKGIITSAYIDLKPGTDVNSSYYHYLLHSYDEEKVFYNMGNGVRQGINYNVFSKLPILVPTKNETERIVDYLDSKCAKIDSIIEKQQAIIEKLKEYKLSVITEAVTKGLDSKVEMKDSGIEWIGKIACTKKLCKLKTLVDITDGTHDTPQYVDVDDNTHPLVTSKCIVDGIINTELANHISEKDYLEINKRSEVGQYDVIMPMIGTVGNPAIVDFKPNFAIKNVALLRTHNNEIMGKYIVYLLYSKIILNQFDLLNRGGVQNFISQDKLKNLICIQSSNIDEIVKFLDKQTEAINRKIKYCEQLISKLQEYKKSIIYEVVTGKKEV